MNIDGAFHVVSLASLLCITGREHAEVELVDRAIESTKKEILSFLDKNRGTSFDELQERMGVSPKILVLALKSLEDDGVIRTE